MAENLKYILVVYSRIIKTFETSYVAHLCVYYIMFWWLGQVLVFVFYIISHNLYSMKRLEGLSVAQSINVLFSCREKCLRFQHHNILLSYYLSRRAIPKGFLLNFHTGLLDGNLTSRVDAILKNFN